MMTDIIQIIDALDYGDAVSSHVLKIKKILDANGISNKVVAKSAHDKVKGYCSLLDELINDELVCSTLIYHYSGYSRMVEDALRFKTKKRILVFHNITPPEYFKDIPEQQKECINGYEQLPKIVDLFDELVGVSPYNCETLRQYTKRNMTVIPIPIDYENLKSYTRIEKIIDQYCMVTNFLCIGRIAPNKCIEDVIKVFEHYHMTINNNSRLLLVGRYDCYQPYFEYLKRMVNDLSLDEKVLFLGKVSDQELMTFYNIADVYLSMSEHEGFCVPLLESMYFCIPTLAYKTGGVPATMGPAGVLIEKKDHPWIAEFVHYLLTNKRFCFELIEGQTKWVEKFSLKNMEKQLLELVVK